MNEFAAQYMRALRLCAVTYADDLIPTNRTEFQPNRWHFARHYFNKEGLEVAFFIPALLSLS